MDWEPALEDVGRRLAAIREEHGKDAIALYHGNPNGHIYHAMIYTELFIRMLDTERFFSPGSVNQQPKNMSNDLLFGNPCTPPAVRRMSDEPRSDPSDSAQAGVPVAQPPRADGTGRVKAASAKDETRASVVDASRSADAGPDSLAPVLDEEILEPRGCIRWWGGCLNELTIPARHGGGGGAGGHKDGPGFDGTLTPGPALTARGCRHRRRRPGAWPGWYKRTSTAVTLRSLAGVHRKIKRDSREPVLRRRARWSEGAAMVEREATLEPRTGVWTWGVGPPVFCAIAGRQPWIDRISDRFFERSFEEAFRRSVEAFRARERLCARAFGSAALGNPDFVEELLCGGDGLRLDTVDAVLAFMGEQPLGPLFAWELEAFLGITGTGAQRLGLGAVGDMAFVKRIRVGEAPRLRAVDRVRRWMGLHSSPAQRRAIAAATLVADGWRTDMGEGREHTAWRGPGNGYAHAGASPVYLDTRQAAAMVGLSPRTLEYYRTTGQGPAFFKLGGRVRYSVAEIERWVRATRRYCTRERAGPKRAATARESASAM